MFEKHWSRLYLSCFCKNIFNPNIWFDKILYMLTVVVMYNTIEQNWDGIVMHKMEDSWVKSLCAFRSIYSPLYSIRRAPIFIRYNYRALYLTEHHCIVIEALLIDVTFIIKWHLICDLVNEFFFAEEEPYIWRERFWIHQLGIRYPVCCHGLGRQWWQKIC